MNSTGKGSPSLTIGIIQISVGQVKSLVTIGSLSGFWQHQCTSPIHDLGLEGSGHSNRKAIVLAWLRPDPRRLEVGDGVVFGSRSELVTSGGLGSIKIEAGAMIPDRVVLPVTHVAY